MNLGTLADGLGCFPFAIETYLTMTDSCTSSYGIRSLTGFGKLVDPLVLSVLYLRNSNTRLYLNIFRGERAITQFDWPFTPSHKSSKQFSTYTGSDLHTILLVLHPAHG